MHHYRARLAELAPMFDQSIISPAHRARMKLCPGDSKRPQSSGCARTAWSRCTQAAVWAKHWRLGARPSAGHCASSDRWRVRARAVVARACRQLRASVIGRGARSRADGRHKEPTAHSHGHAARARARATSACGSCPPVQVIPCAQRTSAGASRDAALLPAFHAGWC